MKKSCPIISMTKHTIQITHKNATATVQISGESSLHDLADILLESIGFYLDHAFGFYSNLKGPAWGRSATDGEHYTLFTDMKDMGEEELLGAESVKNTLVKNVFHEGREMLFFFDYGDAWSFLVQCTKIEKNAKLSPPKIITQKGPFPEQYPDYEEEEEVDDEVDNIIPINQNADQSPPTLPLFVYISGGCQKLFGIKPREISKDSEVDLSTSTPLSLWRCELMRSDPRGKHLFLFTHATTFFSIVVFQEELKLDACLRQFLDELLFRLEDLIKIPEPLGISIKTIKGNPRGLITTMNQIINESNYTLDERFQSYEMLEDGINGRPRSKNLFIPSEAFSELLKKETPFLH